MTNIQLQIRDVLNDAEWLAHRYDPGHDAFHFHRVPRARHAQIPFLTGEYLSDGDSVVLRRADAVAHAPEPAPLHFLFHSAYCCSTLLAAAFDSPGLSIGLKEPTLLNDLVGWRHRGAAGGDVARVLDQSLHMLARPFGPGEAVLVKPSNVVNPMISGILGLRPQARALLLYAPLDAYLASIARKGMWGRLWVRDLFQKLDIEGMLAPLGVERDQYLGLTDIQVAAVGWLAQQRQFEMLTMQFGDRVATIDSETLIAQPGDALSSLAGHFALSMTEETIADIVSGPVFARDAKNGEYFAAGQRARQAQEGLEVHGEEIAKVAHWASVLAENAVIPMTLSRPLLG